MTSYVALLRAVNVSGTGKLPMAELKSMCEAAGFQSVRTYIASGNVVFRSNEAEPAIAAALVDRLQVFSGKPVGVLVRSAAEMARIVSRNPFQGEAPNRVMVIFLPAPVPVAALAQVTGAAPGEAVRAGEREIYVLYPNGLGQSKLRIPAARAGRAEYEYRGEIGRNGGTLKQAWRLCLQAPPGRAALGWLDVRLLPAGCAGRS